MALPNRKPTGLTGVLITHHVALDPMEIQLGTSYECSLFQAQLSGFRLEMWCHQVLMKVLETQIFRWLQLVDTSIKSLVGWVPFPSQVPTQPCLLFLRRHSLCVGHQWRKQFTRNHESTLHTGKLECERRGRQELDESHFSVIYGPVPNNKLSASRANIEFLLMLSGVWGGIKRSIAPRASPRTE